MGPAVFKKMADNVIENICIPKFVQSSGGTAYDWERAQFNLSKIGQNNLSKKPVKKRRTNMSKLSYNQSNRNSNMMEDY